MALSHSSLFFSKPSLPHVVTHTTTSLSYSPSHAASLSIIVSFSLSLSLSLSLYFHHRLCNTCFIVLTNPLLLFFIFLFCSYLMLSYHKYMHTKFPDFDKADLAVSSFLGSLTLKWRYKLQNIKKENEKSRNLQLLCSFSSSPLLLLLLLLSSSSSFLVLSASLYFFFSCFVRQLLPF